MQVRKESGIESERSPGKESEFFSRCGRYWRLLGGGQVVASSDLCF